MKKASVILVLLIALTALVFFNTGCKPKEVAKEPVKIEFWTTETESDRQAVI